MGKYIGKRLLLMIPVVIGVAITIFTIMYFVPGDPAQIILGTSATEADLAAKRTELGLDQPYLVRLGTYLFERTAAKVGEKETSRKRNHAMFSDFVCANSL